MFKLTLPRRVALALLILSASPLAPVAPGWTGLAALADDDAPGGGGLGPAGPSGPDGPGGGGGMNMWGQGRRVSNCFFFSCPRQQRSRRMAREQVRKPAAPLEFVLFDVGPEARGALERARFAVLADGPLTTAAGRILRVRAPEGMGARTALRRLTAAAPSATVARNDIYRSFLRPAARAQGRAARSVTLTASVGCAAGATVAMVDTDVDPRHPALAGAAISRMAMRAPDRRPSTSRHGTAVASMLVGREDGPAPGLAPGLRLVVVDAFHADASGQDATDAFDLARALDLLANQEASVINLSLTGPDNAVLARVVAQLVGNGRALVAAAGNDGPKAKPLYPAAYSGVIAVTAVDVAGVPWRRAARGAHVAFAAMGVDLALAGRKGEAESYSGTSFAAPAVSAMIAAKGIAPGDGPAAAQRASALYEGLAALAEDKGERGRDPVYGHGVLQPGDACRFANKPAQK